MHYANCFYLAAHCRILRVKWAQVTISDVNIIRVFSGAEMCCHSPSTAVCAPPPPPTLATLLLQS